MELEISEGEQGGGGGGGGKRGYTIFDSNLVGGKILKQTMIFGKIYTKYINTSYI